MTKNRESLLSRSEASARKLDEATGPRPVKKRADNGLQLSGARHPGADATEAYVL